MCSQVYSCVFVCIHVYSCVFVCIHVYPCVLVCIHVCPCVLVCIHEYSCVCVFRSIYRLNTHEYTRTHTNTHEYTRTHTNTHEYTRTHTNTHEYVCIDRLNRPREADNVLKTNRQRAQDKQGQGRHHHLLCHQVFILARKPSQSRPRSRRGTQFWRHYGDEKNLYGILHA